MNSELEELARETAENIVAQYPVRQGLVMFLPDYESEDDLRFLSRGPLDFPGAGSLEMWRAEISNMRDLQDSRGIRLETVTSRATKYLDWLTRNGLDDSAATQATYMSEVTGNARED